MYKFWPRIFLFNTALTERHGSGFGPEERSDGSSSSFSFRKKKVPGPSCCSCGDHQVTKHTGLKRGRPPGRGKANFTLFSRPLFRRPHEPLLPSELPQDEGSMKHRLRTSLNVCSIHLVACRCRPFLPFILSVHMAGSRKGVAGTVSLPIFLFFAVFFCFSQ